MMTLDHLRGIALDRHTLDHVRIQCALCEKFVAAMSARAVSPVFLEQLFSRVLKHLDELVADSLSFALRVSHAFQQCKKTFARIHIFQTDMKIFTEDTLYNFFFARAQQTVIDKNAGELVADRLVQKRSRH